MKIVVLDGQTLNPGDLSWDCIKNFGDLTVYDRTNGEDLAIQRIGDAEIVILNKTPITQRILESCPSIKLICVLATGYNVVDCSAAAKWGIPVCNAPGYSTNAVAQFTFGLLLELCHQIGHHSKLVHDGAWTRCPNFCFWDTPQMELAGKTLGIIGFGSIGQAVAKIAQAMGMQVLAYSRTQRPKFSHVYTDLDTLLSSSDVISLHCPLFPETEKIINAQSIAKMKDGAILLNTARGPLIDEQAVADALRSGKLLGAAMDVVCAEPIAANNPLLTAPNCIITPHIAWAPMETRKRILDITTNSIQGFLDGNLVNVVNM
ncbi:MAG: D-2-hydroxyacid dehydrogenase [Oscillospiraceae bacterium]|nr:D-2-hydroxyacid dehydrogenase [Oscillospiraceae bacterium]